IESSGFWPYAAAAAAFQSIDLVPGAAGVFSVVDYVDDDTAAVNLGSNTFNFFGTPYTGASSLFASSNGLITFGSAEGTSGNTDLTFAPGQAAIAPLWDDWRTDLDLNDQVLGKFEDTTGDGVADRLILEWNRVQHYDTSPSDVTFQAILQLNTGATPGAITFNYPDLDTGDGYRNGASATVGIKDSGSQGDNRLLVSYNDGANPLVGSGKAIQIRVGAAADRPPVLSPIADQSMPTTQDILTVSLNATDPDNDPLSFSAQTLSQAYYLDQQLGLVSGGLFYNWGGAQDKWFQGGGGAWYYMLPDGRFYHWSGTGLTGALVATLDVAYYNDPARLYNAVPEAVNATATVNGSTLTIDPSTGYAGTFYVTVSASDGRGGSDQKTFAITVTAAAVNHAPIADQTITAGARPRAL